MPDYYDYDLYNEGEEVGIGKKDAVTFVKCYYHMFIFGLGYPGCRCSSFTDEAGGNCGEEVGIGKKDAVTFVKCYYHMFIFGLGYPGCRCSSFTDEAGGNQNSFWCYLQEDEYQGCDEFSESKIYPGLYWTNCQIS